MICSIWREVVSSRKFEEVSIISGTGAAICTVFLVVQCNGKW
jgi:hypothetical protein